MRRTGLALIVFVFALDVSQAYAVTLQEVVALSKAGVSSQVIVALIERDQTVFALGADQLVSLRNDGVSEEVVIAMLSGRSQPPQVQEPIIVVVGRGPDRPHATEPFASGVAAAPDFVPPFSAPYAVVVPYLVPTHEPRSRCTVREAVAVPLPPNATGIFFTTPSRGMFFAPPDPAAVPTRPGSAGPRSCISGGGGSTDPTNTHH